MQSSLTERVQDATSAEAPHEPSAHDTEEIYVEESATWEEYQANELEFDDTGEGAFA